MGELCGYGMGSGTGRWDRGPGGEVTVCSQLVGCEGGAKCRLETPCRGEERMGA